MAVVLVPLLLVPIGSAAQSPQPPHPDSRAALDQQERDKRASQLKPWEPDRGEQIYQRAIRNPAVKGFLTPESSWTVKFGGLYPGSGFALGPKFLRRGLHVFCAWLDHTDAKAGDSQDTLVEEDGLKYVRHHLIDFGAIFGSDSDMIKNASFGNEYSIPNGKATLKRMCSFGFNPEPWETAKTPKIRGVGRFHFVHRLPDDEYWAARQVMNFTDQEIRAIVETGQYFAARINARGFARKAATVYLRSAASTPQIVGVDRTW